MMAPNWDLMRKHFNWERPFDNIEFLVEVAERQCRSYTYKHLSDEEFDDYWLLQGGVQKARRRAWFIRTWLEIWDIWEVIKSPLRGKASGQRFHRDGLRGNGPDQR